MGKTSVAGGVVAVAAVVAISVGAFAVSHVHDHAQGTGAATGVSVASDLPTISDDDRVAMLEVGDTLRVVGSAPQALTITQAVAAAQRMRFFAGASPVSATLGRLTDEKSPEIDPSEPRGDSTGPDLHDRLAWVVVFKNASVPVFGELPRDPSAKQPIYPTATDRMWTAVDATTGQILIIRSLDS